MKNLFKDKRVKYGTYSTIVAMIFLAILDNDKFGGRTV